MQNFLVFILLFTHLFSCLPTQEGRVNTLDSSTENSTSDNDSDNTDSGAQVAGDVSWLNAGLQEESVTIDVDNLKSLYLVGDKVHDFLSVSKNFSHSYCVEIVFAKTSTTNPKRLRFKLTPQFSSNLGLGDNTRFFVANTGSALGNELCQNITTQRVQGKLLPLTLQQYIDVINGIEQVISDGQSPALISADVCSNCQNILTSKKITLFRILQGTTTLEAIDHSELDSQNLVFRIDLNSQSSVGQNSCTNSECQALGFNCCVNGQCVNEKQIKISGVNLDPTGFAIAEQEKTIDSNWYKKYPQFYFACLEAPPITNPNPSIPVPENPQGDAQALLESQIQDFECLEEMAANSQADPFHTNPIDSNKSYTKCNITDSQNDLFFESVLKRLYTNCGCVEKNDLATMVSTCPAYTYKAIYKTGSDGVVTSDIQEIVCLSPNPNQTDLPFQNTNVVVNARSVPHRFFDVNNIELFPGESPTPNTATGVQEGEAFQYLDNFFVFPRNGAFNMNSILGQMTTQLDQSHPAKMITVEFDKKYIISTLSGQYSSCSTCGKDSWFNNFTAFPFTINGKGAQSVGFTTRRDTFESNTSLGNYEDTIFNRACFVPPTMLPYSHLENANVQTQRLNRLKTQASLFINGYQRDWYGFNKGALIGSFDGVKWFAIGTGRIVHATSNKLYLAINGAFGDLTSPSSHQVAVQEYDFRSVAAIFDYDPNLEINDSTQNQAASCQENHKCEVDADCITSLGWEYVCSDVGLQKTQWPNFNPTGALELANDKLTGSIINFLQQATLPPNSGSKRCIYRGAGAPCRVDYPNITDEGLRKNLTCAPNFYCARLSDSGGFNREVARFGRPLEDLVTSKNHLFGQDANVLGRPLEYINTGTLGALPVEATMALETNLRVMDSSGAGQFGLCRPGKKVPVFQSALTARNTDPADQHTGPDLLGRTDFISQVGACNSALYLPTRYSSCPILDSEGNYVHTQDSFLQDAFLLEDILTPQPKDFVIERLSFAQNACGLESLAPTALPLPTMNGEDLKNLSAFRTIEASPLGSSNTIITETLARDGCLRKAGAVCHTDLDCSPNRLHASSIDLVSASFFGNLAEKSYYSEALICGQAKREPAPTAPDFLTYTSHNNRCCRPVGENLTMFTEDSPRAIESTGIDTSTYGSLHPTAVDRYSRYSVVEASINAITLKSNLIRPSAFSSDADNNKTIDRAVNITNENQWKTIHKTAAKTCCGGSWIRKFEDGSNNWNQNRSNLNTNNFKCLNYRSALYLTEDAPAYGLKQFELENERRNFCFDGRTEVTNDRVGGCIQHTPIPSPSAYRTFGAINNIELVTKPRFDETSIPMRLSSSFNTMAALGNFNWNRNVFAYYPMTPLSGAPFDSNNGYVLSWSDAPNAASTTNQDDIDRGSESNFMASKLPSFITFNQVEDLKITLTDPTDPALDVLCTRVQASGGSSTGIGGTIDPNYTIPTVCNGRDGNAGLCDESSGLWFEEAGTTILANFNFANPPSSAAISVDGNGIDDMSFCPDLAGNNCCYIYDEEKRIVRAAFSNADIMNTANYSVANVEMKIEFEAVGTLAWELAEIARKGNPSVDSTDGFPHRRSTVPGNAMYYLKKLAKLEYVGIPQMTYEPIYCNDNYQKVVPGIFNDSIKTVTDFIQHPQTFEDPGLDTPWESDSAPANINANSLNRSLAATQELLQIAPIFSDNQFKCCLELGSTINSTDDPGLCCSGFATQTESQDNTKRTCQLPPKTDLNVYFNKFVSGEGITPGDIAHLNDEDFDPKTGGPMATQDILAKLREIGEKHCSSGAVRTGAAFGTFQATPIGSLSLSGPSGISTGSQIGANIFSITDEIFDDNPDDSNQLPTGNTQFNAGFRWNHHVYCDVE